MSTVLGVLIVLLAAFSASRMTAGAMTDRLASVLTTATVFFAIFLGAFVFQGFLELALGRPIIALPIAAAFVAAISLASLFRGRAAASTRRTPPVRGSKRDWRPIPLGTAIVVGLVFLLAGVLLICAFPRGFEVRAYHLPLAVRVLRDGTLGIWDQSFMHAYPINMSVWAAFFLQLVPERVVSLINLPFLALLCGAVFALCRSAGGDRSAALLVTAGMATVPIVGFSALEIGADIAGVAFIAVATYLLIARPGSNGACTLVAGLAAGMAYGFKSLHLIPLAALGLLVLIDGIIERRRSRRRDWHGVMHAFGPLFVFMAAAFAMMSFWLVRNYLQAGNPLYPVYLPRIFDWFSWKAAPDFDLGSRTGNETEWVGQSWKWLLYPWIEGNVVNQNFKHSSGLGAFFAATVPTIVVLWPVHVVQTWSSRKGFAFAGPLRAQVVLYLLASTVVLAWCLLGDRQPRYVMAAIILLFPLAAWLISRAHALRTRYEILLSICTLTMALVIAVRMISTNGVAIAQNMHAARNDLLEYPAAIDRLPNGSVVANGVGREVNYTLLGNRLANRVVDTLEVDRRFGGPDGALRFTLSALASSGITHLYVASDRKVSADRCVGLREIDRLEYNPFNGKRYDAARVLYAVDRLCEPAS